MTTIAVSEGMMASDGQATKGYMALPGNFKKIHKPDEATEYWEANGIKIIAFGVCGQAHSVEFIKEYLRKGIDYKSRVEHADELDFEAVLITEMHDVFAWDVYANKEKRGEQQFLVPCNTPYATGSGGRIALAAMCVGQNAAKSVKTAIKIVPVNGSFNGITTHRFTGAAVITDANGVSLTTIEAEDHMAKEVDNGTDN